MITSKEPDAMLSACAEIIIDRLYELALCDNRIMVCNWLAYAMLAAYRVVNELTGDVDIPTLDECFDGSAVPAALSSSPKWRTLQSMHKFHWKRANTPEGESEYEGFFSIVAMDLDGFILCQ